MIATRAFDLAGKKTVEQMLGAFIASVPVGQRHSEIRLVRYRDREELLVVLRANFLVH